MNILIQLSGIIIVILFMVNSKYFYYRYLEVFTNKAFTRLGYTLSDLKYSFEEIIYFIPLPSHNPSIANASRDDLYFKKDFISFIFPTIKGIKIILKDEDGADHLIAYISKDSFRLPLLDKLLFSKKIDKETYIKITSYKLIHPTTINEILNQVYLQLHHMNP